MNNFLGKDGYVWWVGVVEDINDPLQLARCRVRIFGWHSENKNDIPVEDLPWAQSSFSPSGSNKWAVPNLGDWVIGFFGDGLSAQFPVMTGVMPGIYREAGSETGSSGNKGFQDGRTPEQKAAGPQLPAGQVRYTNGKPTTPPLARGIVANTAVGVQNSNRAHTCDFANDLVKNNQLKKYLMAEAQQIRDAIRAIMKALGFTDTSGQFTALTNALKAIARELKRLQKDIIQPILDFEKSVLGYIATAQKIIQWILSLPAQLISLLADCLNKLIQGIKNIFTDILSGSSGSGSDLLSAAKDVVSAGKSLASSTITAVAGAAAIATAAQATVQQAAAVTKVPQQLASSVSSLGTIATAATIGAMASGISNIGSSYPSSNSALSSAQSSAQPSSTP